MERPTSFRSATLAGSRGVVGRGQPSLAATRRFARRHQPHVGSFLSGAGHTLFRDACLVAHSPNKTHRISVWQMVRVEATSVPMKVMIAGPPASGKGTQSQKIVDKYGLEHVCVGDLLRAQIEAGTSAGARAKGYMSRGELVPNEIVVDMVKESLTSDKALSKGWLLDGYPRSLDQATAIEQENIRPDVFLLLNVPDEVLIERVVGRRLDPETGEIYHIKYKPPPSEIQERLVQRFDDTEEKAVNRLNTYHSNLESILDVYKDVTVEIDGNGTMEEVFDLIEQALIAENRALAAEP